MLSDRPVRSPRALYPGAFNPVHQGHLGVARIAAELLKTPVDFELSIWNVEKPALDLREIDRRVIGLREAVTGNPMLGHLWLTEAPTFPDKALHFPEITFVVGLDTFYRIADHRFYDGVDGFERAMDVLKSQGTRFLVFFRQVDDLIDWDNPTRYPSALASIATFVPRTLYTDPERLSSREIRGER